MIKKIITIALLCIVIISIIGEDAKAISDVLIMSFNGINASISNADYQTVLDDRGHLIINVKSFNDASLPSRLTVAQLRSSNSFYNAKKGYVWETYFTIVTTSKSSTSAAVPNCSINSGTTGTMNVTSCSYQMFENIDSYKASSASANNEIYNISATGSSQVFQFHIEGEILNDSWAEEKTLRLNGGALTLTDPNMTISIFYDRIKIWKPNESEIDAINKGNEAEQNRWDEENNKAEEAQNANNGTPNTNEAQNTANGYFEIFNTIFGAATSGNCTLPEISAYGFSLGEINLCTLSPPNWVRNGLGAVASITAAWCGIKIIKRVVDVAIGGISR